MPAASSRNGAMIEGVTTSASRPKRPSPTPAARRLQCARTPASSERDQLASLDVPSTTNSVADRRPDGLGIPVS
jgi:hypothetical protein